MKNDLHAQAKELIARRHVEGLSVDDERRLSAHLLECESCATAQHQLKESLSALRAMNLDLPSNLASRAQFRVRMRAEELREKEPARKFVWAIAAVSWTLGVATAPWVWHGVEWLGHETGPSISHSPRSCRRCSHTGGSAGSTANRSASWCRRRLP